MKKWPLFLALVGTLAAAGAFAAGPDPRERNFKLFVDGAEIAGVVGYRIDFARMPITRDDSRRLGIAYSPDQRQLSLTLTQKGLNRLQDWLNGATDTTTPVTKGVAIEAYDNEGTLLARWELTSVAPSTFSSAAAGNIDEVDATVEFVFDRLRLTQANGK
jgi:hypothetical protein